MDDMHPVIMELKDQSAGFVRLSWCFKAEILKTVSCDFWWGLLTSNTHPVPISCQHTTSNGHLRDEWIFCLVCPQCSLLYLLVSPLSECFTDILIGSWHRTTARTTTQHLFYLEGQTRGEALLPAIWVNRGHKAAASSVNIPMGRRRGSQDHYLRGLNFLFWHAQQITQRRRRHEGNRKGWSKRGTQYQVQWVTWIYTQSLLRGMKQPSIYCLLGSAGNPSWHSGSGREHPGLVGSPTYRDNNQRAIQSL